MAETQSHLQTETSNLVQALRQKVIFATPNNGVALLKTIAFDWRQQAVAANAEKMREEGTRLYDRVANFTEQLMRMGKSLRQSAASYNKAVGSLEHELLPGARRFTEMGIQPRKQLGTPEPVERSTRAVPAASSGEPDEAEHADAGASAEQPNA